MARRLLQNGQGVARDEARRAEADSFWEVMSWSDESMTEFEDGFELRKIDGISVNATSSSLPSEPLLRQAEIETLPHLLKTDLIAR